MATPRRSVRLRSVVVAAVPVALLSCGTPDTSLVRIIGHGGIGSASELPMNSAKAAEAGLALGLDGIEMDVQLTADSVLVAYHDQHLEELTNCTGLVNAMTWEQLRQCRMSTHDAPGIARLDSLLVPLARQHRGTDFTLDCKLFARGDWWPYLESYTNAIVALNRLPALQGRLLVECQVDDLLLLLQRKQPYIPLYRYATDMEEAIWRATASHFTGIVVSNDRVDRAGVAKAQELGLEVTIFGVGGRISHRRALWKRPDRLQTDAPALLIPPPNGSGG